MPGGGGIKERTVSYTLPPERKSVHRERAERAEEPHASQASASCAFRWKCQQVF